MVCKFCKNEIPQGSIYCLYCGERQVKEKKKEIKVPRPRQLPSGSWRIRLQKEGQSITEATPELCITKAKAIRAGFLDKQKKAPNITAKSAIEKYIKENTNTLSPSTLYVYKKMSKLAFPGFMDKDLSSVPWQAVINEEAERVSPKTVKNEWGLVKTVMRANGITPPEVHLPQIIEKELPWLSYSEIKTFLAAINGQRCEMAALLALHSLRLSELLCVTKEKAAGGKIRVEGAVVQVEKGYTEKEANKTKKSRRQVPIMIPRLQELIDTAPDGPLVTIPVSTCYKQINSICQKAGLPETGFHGLRRAFASLCYHLGWNIRETMAVGGWSSFDIVHKVYIKLEEDDLKQATDSMKAFYEK